jgi:hypothetical protein
MALRNSAWGVAPLTTSHKLLLRPRPLLSAMRTSTTTSSRRARTTAIRPRALLSVFQPKQATTATTTTTTSRRTTDPASAAAQQTILAALTSARGRGREGLSPEQLAALDNAVAQLESSKRGQPDAASSPDLDGRWRLVFTSRPGSASPIQRTFVGVDSFSIFQDVRVNDENTSPRVDNVVVFGRSEREAWGYLRVEAEASTSERPLDGFTPRQGAGLPLFGKSFNTPPAAGPKSRIDFQFDQAAFNLWDGKVKIPYPVPFRLLGDERKGWLDVTYLSADGKFRLARGNKGTLFVLLKQDEEEDVEDVEEEQQSTSSSAAASTPTANPFARLFAAAPSTTAPPAPAVDDVVAAARASAADPSDANKAAAASDLVERLVAAAAAGRARGAFPRPARNARAVHGKWRLVWTQQSESASALQRWGASQAKSYQVIDALDRGLAMNVVDLRPFAEVRAYATCEAKSDSRTGVRIGSGEVIFGPRDDGEGGLFSLPLPIKGSDDGYVDWLYLDKNVRVTRGSKGSLFLHVRESDDATSIPDF